MQLSIPIKGRIVRVDTDAENYDSAVLASGYCYVVRYNTDQVAIVLVGENGSGAEPYIDSMPQSVHDLFRSTGTEKPEERKSKAERIREPRPVRPEVVPDPTPEPVVQAAADEEPKRKQMTPEEAQEYIKTWKDKGLPKPGGSIYKLARQNGAAQRAVGSMKQAAEKQEAPAQA